MSPDSSDDNRTMSVFTSKLTPAADVCVGLTILSIGMCTALFTFLSPKQLPAPQNLTGKKKNLIYSYHAQ